MRYYLNGIIVVEGKEDVSFISSYIESYYVTTNGLDVPKKELAFLKRVSEKKIVVVLTDPDEAGEIIRKRINESVNNVINVKVSIDKCNKRNKHGVAECNIEEIMSVLGRYLSKTPLFFKNIDYSFLFNNQLNNQTIRSYLSDKFCLGIINNSSKLIERLNILEISKKEILDAVEDFQDGN